MFGHLHSRLCKKERFQGQMKDIGTERTMGTPGNVEVESSMAV